MLLAQTRAGVIREVLVDAQVYSVAHLGRRGLWVVRADSEDVERLLESEIVELRIRIILEIPEWIRKRSVAVQPIEGVGTAITGGGPIRLFLAETELPCQGLSPLPGNGFEFDRNRVIVHLARPAGKSNVSLSGDHLAIQLDTEYD